MSYGDAYYVAITLNDLWILLPYQMILISLGIVEINRNIYFNDCLLLLFFSNLSLAACEQSSAKTWKQEEI
jgi:hypothetical protein